MDVIEAMKKRQSIRGFKPEPVPPEILKKILQSALNAPSAVNSQPWELAVVSGEKLREIRKTYKDIGPVRRLDIDMPSPFPEPWFSRRAGMKEGLLDSVEIAREDKKGRDDFGLYCSGAWNAPCCIYIMIDRNFYLVNNVINQWSVFDCGLITQSILLLATEFGLGTVPALEPVLNPDIIRKVLGLPDSKLIAVSISIGYPDWDDPINKFRTPRETLENVATFYS